MCIYLLYTQITIIITALLRNSSDPKNETALDRNFIKTTTPTPARYTYEN